MFVGLTLGMTATEKRAVAWRACWLIAFVILAAFAFGGRPAQAGKRKSAYPPFASPANRCRCSTSPSTCLFALRGEAQAGDYFQSNGDDHDHIRNIAAFPLAIPLMAGPATRSQRPC